MADKVIPDPTSLDLATDNELLDELGRRNLAVLVVMLHEPKNMPHKETVTVMHRGGFHTAAGLAQQTRAYFIKQMR